MVALFNSHFTYFDVLEGEIYFFTPSNIFLFPDIFPKLFFCPPLLGALCSLLILSSNPHFISLGHFKPWFNFFQISIIVLNPGATSFKTS